MDSIEIAYKKLLVALEEANNRNELDDKISDLKIWFKSLEAYVVDKYENMA